MPFSGRSPSPMGLRSTIFAAAQSLRMIEQVASLTSWGAEIGFRVSNSCARFSAAVELSEISSRLEIQK